MANSGPNTNKSRFFITFAKLPMLDGRHVVFGYLLSGFETLTRIDEVGSPVTGVPRAEVRIADVGEFDQRALAALGGEPGVEKADRWAER